MDATPSRRALLALSAAAPFAVAPTIFSRPFAFRQGKRYIHAQEPDR